MFSRVVLQAVLRPAQRILQDFAGTRTGFLTSRLPFPPQAQPSARPLSSAMTFPKVERVVKDEEIIKSAEDKRVYQALELENKLKVLLISDPTTDESSAALDVHIGHMSDPNELPGLAHFCEHMLFLGTEKYPKEDEYNKYLSEHAGSSNAFTSAEHTNYYFDVGPDHLAGALNRFAQFFLCPLFTPSATDREVNAVNSENDKNLQSDPWRMFQLEKSTSNPDHPYSKFGSGNKMTLETIPKEKGINTRDELLKFHKKFYSANLMGLAILGKESLDELREMILPLFSDVLNKEVEKPEWPEHPYGPEQVKLQAHIVPVKDIRSLSITWPIPDLHPHYKSNPGHYLGHLIGHEGPGSLLSELKGRGWVNTIVGGQKAGANGFMFFIVNVDLSEEGIEHTDDIVQLTFQYLNMLRQAGPQEWCFKECQDLNAMQFRFKDKEKPRNYTSHVASMLHDYPLTEVLSGGILLEEYRPDLYSMVLDKLTPDTIRVAVIGQKFAGQTDKTEKWYKTEYSILPIPEKKLDQWRNCGLHPNLKLPMRNEFIPTDFEILPREKEEAKFPFMIKDSDMSRVWYKQDDKFLLPKACINVAISSPYAFMDPVSTNLTHMFVTLFQDALNEYAYDAELAGINYDLHNTVYGLTLNVSGYADKQAVLLKRIMEKMTCFTIDQQRFDVLKENYIRNLKNFKAEQPHQHAIYHTTMLLSEQMWTKDELLDATEELSVEKLKQFIPHLLSRMFLEFLIYGNVTQEKAHRIVEVVETALKERSGTKPLIASQRNRFREIQLPDNCYYVLRSENDVHNSSSLEIYYQCSIQGTQTNIQLELFCQIIGQPFFDIIRTKEQLGYLVFSGIRRGNGVQGLRIIVQSDKEPDYVESRIEAFLKHMKDHIEEMTGEVFENHVSALATRRLEQAKKMTGQNSRYWSEIFSHQYNFDRDEIEVAYLRSVTKDDILKFYRELISPDAPHRHKTSVHVVSTAEGSTGEARQAAAPPKPDEDGRTGLLEAPVLPEPVIVCDVNEFKRGLPLFPAVQSFIPLTMDTKSKL